MWYVIQVVGGKEDETLELLRRIVDRSIVLEAFIPRRHVMHRRDGVWRTVDEILFPGYLFVVTHDPEGLVRQLRRVPRFTRLLGESNRKFVPLPAREVELLKEFGGPFHVVGMSQGVIDGDCIRIEKGPLKGREAIIRKVDRHKRIAFVEMDVMGRRKTVKLGLEIVRKSS
ncbi:MAG: antiterminator LoaP [Slackia sp.]|nr:antiterminator LoaP [Slackia sp.]